MGKLIYVTTPASAKRLQVESLFHPGGTLNRVRYGGGKYKNRHVGDAIEVPDHVDAVFFERRRDSYGPYYAAFAMVRETREG